MAIVSVRKMFTSRGGKDTWKRKRTYTRMFEVVVDNENDSEVEAANATDPETGVTVPVLYEQLPENFEAVVTDVDAQQSDDSFFIWYVTVTYDTQPENASHNEPDKPGGGEGKDAGPLDKDPTKRAASWKVTSVDKSEIVREWVQIGSGGEFKLYSPPAWVAARAYSLGTYVNNGGIPSVYICSKAGISGGGGGPAGFGNAAQGNAIVDNTAEWSYVCSLNQATTDPNFAIPVPVVNSGKMPFDPPPVIDVSYPVVSVTQSMPPGFLSLDYAMRIKNAVNKIKWRGVPPRCGKIIKFELSRSMTENTFSYVEASWDIQLDPDTFDLRLLDQGFGNLATHTVPNPAPPPATIQKKDFYPFRDAGGNVLENAVPMDGNGKRLDPDADPVILRGVPKQMKLIDFNLELPF